MYIKKNELDALASKIAQKHPELTFLTWGIKTINFDHDDITIVMFFKPNNNPKGRITIERTITELKNL